MSATNDDNVAAKSSTNVATNGPAGSYPVRFNVMQNSTNMDANNSVHATNAPSEDTRFPKLADLASKIKNIEGKMMGADGKPLKPRRKVQVDATTVEINPSDKSPSEVF